MKMRRYSLKNILSQKEKKVLFKQVYYYNPHITNNESYSYSNTSMYRKKRIESFLVWAKMYIWIKKRVIRFSYQLILPLLYGKDWEFLSFEYVCMCVCMCVYYTKNKQYFAFEAKTRNQGNFFCCLIFIPC